MTSHGSRSRSTPRMWTPTCKYKQPSPCPSQAARTSAPATNLMTSFARRAYDIAQPDVVNAGGITEMRNIAMTANSYGILVNPHVWGSPVMIAASLHLASTIPPCPPAYEPRPYEQEPVMEFDRTPSGIREGITVEPFDQQDGFITVPTGARPRRRDRRRRCPPTRIGLAPVTAMDVTW